MRKYYVTSDTSLYHTFLLKRGLAVSRIRNFSAVAPNAEREFVYPEYYRIIGNPVPDQFSSSIKIHTYSSKMSQ